MVRGVVAGCRCAVGEGPGDDAVVDPSGGGEGGERGFQREGVGVEPVEEGRGAEDAGVGVLGGVDVCVFKQLNCLVSWAGC